MRITRVTATPIRPAEARPASWLSESLVANPMSIYPEYRERRSSWGARWGAEVLVRIETDDGLVGIGGNAPAPAKPMIEQHFANLLAGQDPFAVEKLWDQMFRSSLPYGRKGLPIMAISAVDVALWDLIGKATGQPLWRLLGGKVRDRLPTYSTGNDVARYQALGFRAFKLAMPHGPADGWEGMKGNVALVEQTRATVGPDAEIMLDCYMAWNVEYTVRMAHLLEPYRVRWIEECLPPDDYDGYAHLTRTIQTTTVATGEHEYTRYGFKELIGRGCCHILQPDLAWVGGITEARKVAAMASAWGLDVIPHAGGLQPWAIHFIASQPNTPWAECVVIGNEGEDDPVRSLYPYLNGVPLPRDGYISPSDEPGVGVTVNPAWLEE
ncbi:MAG: enolase C-terminal domain-like protein [Thermomicrobiales bacterium]